MSSEAVVEVSFGFPSLIGFTFMSGMINKFKEVFPKAQVSMYEAQLSSFLPAIRDGRLDFAIGTLSAEMKLQDLHVEPLFESEFVLVASKSRTCTGTTTLESLKNEQWVLPQTNMGYYSELLTTLQRNGISIENIVKTDSVVTIYNLVLNADFLTVIPCDMTSPLVQINLLLFRLKKHYLWHNMLRYGRKIIVLKSSIGFGGISQRVFIL